MPQPIAEICVSEGCLDGPQTTRITRLHTPHVPGIVPQYASRSGICRLLDAGSSFQAPFPGNVPVNDSITSRDEKRTTGTRPLSPTATEDPTGSSSWDPGDIR